MIDLDAVLALAQRIELGEAHHGECAGVQAEGFSLSECTCPMAAVLGAMRALTREVEWLRHKTQECGCSTRPNEYGGIDDMQCAFKVRENIERIRHIPGFSCGANKV